MSTQGIHHRTKLCIVPSAHKIIWDSTSQMMDDDYCEVVGRSVPLDELERADLYPSENALFYTPVPFLKNNVMSRLFHFLIADIGISFKTSDYPRALMGKSDTKHFILQTISFSCSEHNLNVFHAQVALGYRDGVSGSWTRLASGNISRTVSCSPNHMVGSSPRLQYVWPLENVILLVQRTCMFYV